MNKKNICNKKSLCTGCEACVNICSHNAIKMKHDWKGFLYPEIDSQKCINCGLCNKICPINHSIDKFEFNNAYAFVENNKQLLLKASSGGAFGVIARYIISEGGVVFGASMDEEYNVHYTEVHKLEDLELIYGSKYVQAYVGSAYRNVKKYLNENRKVLFCGCPCQVAGLNSFLKKDYDNLITMDLICHGVPSQPYFKKYVKDLLVKHNKLGYKNFRFRFKPSNKTEKLNTYIGYLNHDYYMSYFLWGKGFRSSCYKCKFAGGKRPGDFTIGDFWNNKNAKLDLDDKQGVSLILFNTEKSKTLSYQFANNGKFLPINSLNDAIGNNGGQLIQPSKYDIRCDLIYILYKIFGLNGPKFLFYIEKLRLDKRNN